VTLLFASLLQGDLDWGQRLYLFEVFLIAFGRYIISVVHNLAVDDIYLNKKSPIKA